MCCTCYFEVGKNASNIFDVRGLRGRTIWLLRGEGRGWKVLKTNSCSSILKQKKIMLDKFFIMHRFRLEKISAHFIDGMTKVKLSAAKAFHTVRLGRAIIVSNSIDHISSTIERLQLHVWTTSSQSCSKTTSIDLCYTTVARRGFKQASLVHTSCWSATILSRAPLTKLKAVCFHKAQVLDDTTKHSTTFETTVVLKSRLSQLSLVWFSQPKRVVWKGP